MLKHAAFNLLNQSNIIVAQKSAMWADSLHYEKHFANMVKPRISVSL
jgi:hypothetical protein